jgi:Domain of Unknown Function (DUF1080)
VRASPGGRDDLVPLFDGRTLTGWRAVPRLPVAPWPGGPAPDVHSGHYRAAAGTAGRWSVEDGAIVGTQDPPGCGLGGYLVTEGTYADFELTFEVRPDWPADTGVMVRATATGNQGFQVLIDHRKSGSIGGFYGNGIGGFHAVAYGLDVARDGSGAPAGLVEEDQASTLEPVTEAKLSMLAYAASAAEFLRAWRWGEWNEMTIRCLGRYPVLTTWVNGVRLYELDAGTLSHPRYDRDEVAGLLGRAGHIALEVHDNDEAMGDARWAPDAVVRWRSFRLRLLGSQLDGSQVDE